MDYLLHSTLGLQITTPWPSSMDGLINGFCTNAPQQFDRRFKKQHHGDVIRQLTATFFATMFLLCLEAAEPEKSVIQITTFSQQPVWDAPWRFEPVRKGTGSGFVIKGKRIVTNAHVVSWAKQVLARRYQDPRPYVARVVHIAHDADVAILEVENERFFDGLEPLQIGELPKVRSTVVTYGYPAGGEQISYTRGVVSRIEMQPYVHIGNRLLLAVQTDAAINPGNSGGPVIQDDKVVGIAFMGTPGLENTGFCIPPPVIRHVLKDIEDGIYDGFPQAGLKLATLQNPSYRQFMQLPDNDQGARIDQIEPKSPAAKLVFEDDVLLQFGPYPVGSDGAVLYQGNRVHVSVVPMDFQSGEECTLKIWRQGKDVDVQLPLKANPKDHAEGNQYVLPRFFIYGGLVFTPLSRDYLKSFGQNWADVAGAELVYELFYRHQETPDAVRSEPIVLSTVLTHPVNANFGIRSGALIDKINGIRINQMEDVIRAFQNPSGTQHTLEFATQKRLECMDVIEANQAGTGILKMYSVSSDRRF